MTDTLETTQLYRFRIWKEVGSDEYSMDDDVYTNEVPLEFIEKFNQSGKVFTIFADSGSIDNAEGPVLLILSQDKESMKSYMAGFFLMQKLDEIFESGLENIEIRE
jgi:hypothetical protein